MQHELQQTARRPTLYPNRKWLARFPPPLPPRHARAPPRAGPPGPPAPRARAPSRVVARGCQTVAGVPMEWRASAACPATLHSAAPLRAAAVCARVAAAVGALRARMCQGAAPRLRLVRLECVLTRRGPARIYTPRARRDE